VGEIELMLRSSSRGREFGNYATWKERMATVILAWTARDATIPTLVFRYVNRHDCVGSYSEGNSERMAHDEAVPKAVAGACQA
jgi:hypothetical protein